MKTIEKTIQQPERYEAPGVKVKVLKKRLTLVQTSGDEVEGNLSDFGTNERE